MAFAHPNKQLCVVTCGDDKIIKVLSFGIYLLMVLEGWALCKIRRSIPLHRFGKWLLVGSCTLLKDMKHLFILFVPIIKKVSR